MFLVVTIPIFAAVAETAPTQKPVPVRAVDVTTSTVIESAKFVGSLVSWKITRISASSPGNVIAISVVSGQVVTKGTDLFQLDDRIASAGVASAKSSMKVANHSFSRSKELVPNNNISKASLDKARNDAELAQAKLAEAEAILDVLTLRAPFDGEVGLITISPGAFVQPGETLVELKDNSKLYVDFQVPQRYLTRLTIGQNFSLVSDAFPDKTVTGTIDFLNPNVNSKTHSLEIRGLVPNVDMSLTGGTAVEVELQLEKKENVLVVPVEALIPTMLGNDVFRIVSSKVERVPVTTGIRYQKLVEVIDGLKASDKVVVMGQFQLQDGMSVTIVDGSVAQSKK